MSSQEAVAVILAAGKGSRVYPLSASKPKPVLPVGNKPLLGHQLALIRTCGIRRVFIAIGHMGYEVVSALGDGSEYGELIATCARVADGAEISGSVVGACATITHPIRIHESLVFPGAVVDATVPLERVIVVDSNTVISCPRQGWS